MHPMTPRERRLAQIDKIAERHGLTVDDVLSKRRFGRIVRAKREVCKTLYAQKINHSEIGRIMGCDRTSVIHLVRTDDRSDRQHRAAV